MKYIVVTGGTISGLGKGTTSACLGFTLKKTDENLKITAIKIDPYLNVDAGYMNPTEHGECFVLGDGTQVDLDLGTYERLLGIQLTSKNSITSGKIFLNVIEAERRGEYLGKTVQMVPHFTDEVLRCIEDASSGNDICIIELGGTIGDDESRIFAEALRQLRSRNKNNFLGLHVSLLPYVSGELKTKPTQHSVKKLREIGYEPDFIICRATLEIPREIKEKISKSCGVPVKNVIDMHDTDIYQIPERIIEENLTENILEYFNIDFPLKKNSPLKKDSYSLRPKNLLSEVKIGIVGKYKHDDSYLSLKHALNFAAWKNGISVNMQWINSEDENLYDQLKEVDGIIIPGGFGNRGIEGKIKTAQFARENQKPFFGICLGMQIAAIEYARNIFSLKNINSEEFSEENLSEFRETKALFLKMENLRLGNKEILLEGNVKVLLGEKITERHRHRYAFNNNYSNIFSDFIVGVSFDKIVEIIDFKYSPFSLGVQFHPEFNSTPYSPHPLFNEFIRVSSL